MNYFLLDAPVLVARYTTGPGYALIDELFALVSQDRLRCSVVSLAEVVAAFVRLRRRGKFTPGLFASAMLQFRMDVLQPSSFVKLPLHGSQVETSLALIDQYQLDSSTGMLLQGCQDHGLSLRAAGNNLVLVSSGRRLLQVARREGLATFNPETESQIELKALIGL